MCGGGLRWDYKPTPQPGDAVKVRVCKVCGKRVKSPTKIMTTVITANRTVVTKEEAENEGIRAGKRAWRTQSITLGRRSTTRTIHSCCSRKKNQVELLGFVERNHWTKYKNGAIAHFFLVVFVPELGRRHWATLETCDRVDPLTALGDVAD